MMEISVFIFLIYGLCSTHPCSVDIIDKCEMVVNVYPYNILQHKNGVMLDRRLAMRGDFLKPIKKEKFNICKKKEIK